MRKAETKPEDDLRGEYDRAELKNGVRGKHLKRYQAGTNLALLAPDVRAAFPTDRAVDEALRSLMRNRTPA
jgi:alpha-beta hydrolase superfamily lysophospholipase